MGDFSRSLENKRRKEACPSPFPAAGDTSHRGTQQGAELLLRQCLPTAEAAAPSEARAPVFAPGAPSAHVLQFRQCQNWRRQWLLASALEVTVAPWSLNNPLLHILPPAPTFFF